MAFKNLHSKEYRHDAGRLSNARRTPQGGYLVDATLTRTGVLEYMNRDGTKRREYRPSDEVFREDSLATLSDAPVTHRHPPGLVTPDNYRDFSRGNVQTGTVRQDGQNIVATLAIQDSELIHAIEAGEDEVSCGYLLEQDWTPGVTESGERYDMVQRSIIYNHVAIVQKGRAGNAALRLDSDGNFIEEKEKTPMFIRIDGVDYDVSTPEGQKAAQAAQARYEAKVAGLQARADAAEAKLVDAQKALNEAQDPKRLDAAVTARLATVGRAQKVLGAAERFDGLSDLEIAKKVVAKAFPTINLDGKSNDYILGLFEASESRADAAGHADVREVVAQRADAKTESKVDTARAKMLAEAAKRSGSKLTFSKD